MLGKALAIHLQSQGEKMHRAGWALQKCALRCAHTHAANTQQVCWPFGIGLPRERGQEKKRQLTVLFPCGDAMNRLLAQQTLGSHLSGQEQPPLAKRQQDQSMRVQTPLQRREEGDPSGSRHHSDGTGSFST